MQYLYLLTAIVYIIIEIRTIRSYKTIRMISLFRLMYAFVFGVLPAIILFRVDSGTANILWTIKKGDIYDNVFLLWLISLIEYIFISFFYKGIPSRIKNNLIQRGEYTDTKVKIAVVLALLIGILSLFLWTNAYGSVFNMMIQANLVRSRASDVVNPWAFLEHFARIFTFTYFVSFALFLYEKKSGKGSLFTFILMLLSLLGSLIVMMCTDTRGEIGILVIVTTLYYFVFYKWANGKNSLKDLIRTGFFFILAFVLIIKSAGIMDSIRGFETDESSSDVIEIVEKEFNYSLRSQVTAIKEIKKDPIQFLIVDDFTNAIFSWVPSRFIPFELPTPLWDYNTQLQQGKGDLHGQSPTDFVAASLYLFGVFGIFLLPLLMGWLLKKLDAYFINRRNSIFHSALCGYMFFFSIWWVGFFSLSSTMLSLFGAFLFWLILKFVNFFIK